MLVQSKTKEPGARSQGLQSLSLGSRTSGRPSVTALRVSTPMPPSLWEHRGLSPSTNRVIHTFIAQHVMGAAT